MRKSEAFFVLASLSLSTAGLAEPQIVPAKATAKVPVVDSLMQKAQELLQAGKFAEAFVLMQSREFERSGDVAFDYILGISAVNSGRPDRATIALERVEALYPEYGDVRMYLGVAYYLTGDVARAKQAFAALLTQKNLAPQSKVNANQYLAAIQQQEAAKQQEVEKAKQAFFVGNAEIGMGHDSNITTAASNNGSGQPSSTGISGNFAQMNGIFEIRKPLFSSGTYGFVMLDSTSRAYSGHGNMNAYTNTLKTGMNWMQGGHTYRVDASRRDFRQQGTVQGSNNNSAQNGVSADARFGLSANDFLGLNVQYNTPRFAAASSAPQDTNQFSMGTNYMHIFPVAGSPVVYFSLTQALDKSVHEIVPAIGAPVAAEVKTNYNRITNTFIAYAQYAFVPSADVTAMWMSSRRNDSSAYARSSTVALPTDEMIVTMFGVNWRPTVNWTVKTQYMGLKNNSVVAGYAFHKYELSVSAKREFK